MYVYIHIHKSIYLYVYVVHTKTCVYIYICIYIYIDIYVCFYPPGAGLIVTARCARRRLASSRKGGLARSTSLRWPPPPHPHPPPYAQTCQRNLFCPSTKAIHPDHRLPRPSTPLLKYLTQTPTIHPRPPNLPNNSETSCGLCRRQFPCRGRRTRGRRRVRHTMTARRGCSARASMLGCWPPLASRACSARFPRPKYPTYRSIYIYIYIYICIYMYIFIDR